MKLKIKTCFDVRAIFTVPSLKTGSVLPFSFVVYINPRNDIRSTVYWLQDDRVNLNACSRAGKFPYRFDPGFRCGFLDADFVFTLNSNQLS